MPDWKGRDLLLRKDQFYESSKAQMRCREKDFGENIAGKEIRNEGIYPKLPQR